jgi:hypothetical protein
LKELLLEGHNDTACLTLLWQVNIRGFKAPVSGQFSVIVGEPKGPSRCFQLLEVGRNCRNAVLLYAGSPRV